MATRLKRTYEGLFDDGFGAFKCSCDKIHNYLGMNLDYTVQGEVKISMVPYISDIVKNLKSMAAPRRPGDKLFSILGLPHSGLHHEATYPGGDSLDCDQ